jgi:TIR domain
MPVPIFVSYSRQDAGLVKPVVGLLRATKDLVFQDVDSVMPGMRWRPQVDEALRVAHLIVLFWCYHSSRSAEVRKEYELALSTGKDVLPVLLDATPLPRELNEYQWVDFREFVGLGHRFLKRWIAIVAAASVAMVGFLGVMVFLERDIPTEVRAPLPAEPAPQSRGPSSPAEESPRTSRESKPKPVPRPPFPTEPTPPAASRWSLIIFPVTALALVIWLVHRVRRSRTRKSMAATLQEELLRRGIGSM